MRLYLGLERDEAVRFTGDGVYHLMPLRVKSMHKKSGPQIAARLGKSGFSLPAVSYTHLTLPTNREV